MDEVGAKEILEVWLRYLFKGSPFHVIDDDSSLDVYREGSTNLAHLIVRVWLKGDEPMKIEFFKGIAADDVDYVGRFMMDLRGPNQLDKAEEKIRAHVEKYG